MIKGMNAKEIAAIFTQIAILMELQGENPFKIRAYQNGARKLEQFTGDLTDKIENNRFKEKIPGIGSALEEKIVTLHITGKLPFFEELKASIPPGLLEMLEIPGLGAKKIKAMREHLGIEDLDTLKKSCEDGKIAELPGFGTKSQEKILSGIANRKAYAKRHLWWSAHAVAIPIVEALRTLPQVKKAEAAGSLRRKMETVGDLDFLVASDDPHPIMDWFTSQDNILEVTAKGETKSSIRLTSGLQADLRVVPQDQFYFALHHFTGSKDHNVLMRQRALRQGLSLSEWGFKCPKTGDLLEDKKIGSEEELFKTLGLSFIPPELREGMGEIEAAETNSLPQLVSESDIRGAFHNHTTESDGHHTLEEMVQGAQDIGWEYVGIADHSKSSFHAHGLSEERLIKQVEAIKQLNTSGKFKTYIFSGTECDILDKGELDFDTSILEQLDYVVVSIHNRFSQDEETMTNRIIKAIEHPCTTMLGHMTGRLLLKREPYSLNTQKIIDAAIANNVIIEINANPKRLDMDWRLWRKAAEKGLLTSINPDAHNIQHYAFVEAGINIARKGWLTKASVFNTKSLDNVKKLLTHRNSQ